MLFKIFLISITLVVFFMLALGLKKFLKPNANPEEPSCTHHPVDTNDEACDSCQIKEIANCDKDKQIKNK